jgi:rhodanese-related sulfurtransferase
MQMPRLRMTVDEAHQLWMEEDATVLDVVDTDAYERTPDQIKGAVRIEPIDIPRRFRELPRDRPVLAYCT